MSKVRRCRRCRRCRQEVPSHLVTRIFTNTGATGGTVYLCPACYAQWWTDEEVAAEQLVRNQARYGAAT